MAASSMIAMGMMGIGPMSGLFSSSSYRSSPNYGSYDYGYGHSFRSRPSSSSRDDVSSMRPQSAAYVGRTASPSMESDGLDAPKNAPPSYAPSVAPIVTPPRPDNRAACGASAGSPVVARVTPPATMPTHGALQLPRASRPLTPTKADREDDEVLKLAGKSDLAAREAHLRQKVQLELVAPHKFLNMHFLKDDVHDLRVVVRARHKDNPPERRSQFDSDAAWIAHITAWLSITDV